MTCPGANPGRNLGQNSGQMQNLQYIGAESQVLDALDELLRSPEVPWPSPRDQAVVEAAVAHRDTSDAELKPVVRKVLDASNALGISLVGSTIFEVLKAFVAG